MRIEVQEFSWNDNFSELAIEDYESIRDKLQYLQCQIIGMALAKLKLIENGELEIKKRKVM